MYILYHFYAMKLNLLKKHLIKKITILMPVLVRMVGRLATDMNFLTRELLQRREGAPLAVLPACRDRCKYWVPQKIRRAFF